MSFRDLDFRKIALLILFLITIFIFGALLYLFFFRPAPVSKEGEGEPLTGGGLNLSQELLVIPTGQEGGPVGLPPSDTGEAKPFVSPVANGSQTYVNTLVDARTLGATLAANGRDLLYYNKTDSRFYKITPDGKTSLLSDQQFFSIDNLSFSRGKDKAIIEYPDGANISYNFGTGEQVTLPKHWEEFGFSKKTEEVAFKNIGLNPENNLLVVANPDGTGAKFIEELGENEDKVNINWSPDNQKVATYTTSLASTPSGEQQEVFFVGKNRENFKSILVEGYSFEGMWSQTGDRMLYSVHNSESDFRPELWIVNTLGNTTGSGRRNLKIQTWAHKCTFASNSEVFCAVPESIGTGYGFIPEFNDSTPDSFYRINLNTQTKELIALPDTKVTVRSLEISEDGKYLYFVDVNTGKLHKINLQ